MADKNLIYNVDVQNLSEVDKLNNGIDEVTNTTKKGGTELSKYRRELNLAKGELLNLEEGTKEYNRALVRVSQLQTKYKAMMDSSKAATRDMGEQAKLVGGAIGGIAGGFQVAAGVMGLFGAESENAQKAIQGIVGAIAVTEGIVRFADTFDSIQDLIAGFRANSAITEMSSFDEVTKTTTQSVDSLGSTLTDLGGTAINASANMTQLNALDGVTKGLKDSLDSLNLSGNTEYLDWVDEAIAHNVELDDSYKVLEMSIEEYYKQSIKCKKELDLLTVGTTEYTDKVAELDEIQSNITSTIHH